MKKMYLMLISATMIMSVASANTEKDLESKKVADNESREEVLMNYANNFEEVTYIHDFGQLALVARTAGINENFKYVRLFKSTEKNSELLALGVTEDGEVVEFDMEVCDYENTNCQCEDSEDAATYGAPVFTEDGCQCIGDCNSSNPY